MKEVTSLTCSVCYKYYSGDDKYENIPIILKNCLHTICSKCVTLIAEDNNIKCPICVKISQVNLRNDKNFALIDVINNLPVLN